MNNMSILDAFYRIVICAINTCMALYALAYMLIGVDAGVDEVVVYRIVHIAVAIISVVNVASCCIGADSTRVILRFVLANMIYVSVLFMASLVMWSSDAMPLDISWRRIGLFCSVAFATCIFCVMRMSYGRAHAKLVDDSSRGK